MRGGGADGVTPDFCLTLRFRWWLRWALGVISLLRLDVESPRGERFLNWIMKRGVVVDG